MTINPLHSGVVTSAYTCLFRGGDLKFESMYLSLSFYIWMLCIDSQSLITDDWLHRDRDMKDRFREIKTFALSHHPTWLLTCLGNSVPTLYVLRGYESPGKVQMCYFHLIESLFCSQSVAHVLKHNVIGQTTVTHIKVNQVCFSICAFLTQHIQAKQREYHK